MIMNNITLVNAEESESNKQLFKSMVLELVKYHKEFADRAEIPDSIIDNYTLESAGKHFNESGYYNYIIEKCGIYVGIVQLELIKSTFNGLPALVFHKVYITKLAQGTGAFSDVVELIHKMFPDIHSIELDCWYNLPAQEIYKHLGFKEAYRHYFKEV